MTLRSVTEEIAFSFLVLLGHQVAFHPQGTQGTEAVAPLLFPVRSDREDFRAVRALRRSALMHAVDQGYHTTAAVLLDGKADLKIVNHNADTIVTRGLWHANPMNFSGAGTLAVRQGLHRCWVSFHTY